MNGFSSISIALENDTQKIQFNSCDEVTIIIWKLIIFHCNDIKIVSETADKLLLQYLEMFNGLNPLNIGNRNTTIYDNSKKSSSYYLKNITGLPSLFNGKELENIENYVSVIRTLLIKVQ